MKQAAAILIFLLLYSCSPRAYNEVLSKRINEIENLPYYNNSVVVYDESSGYGTNYVYWKSNEDYYEDDLVLYHGGKVYRALVDNYGKEPSISPNEWEVVPFSHPYFFLRDTATTGDLKKLLKHKHSYVKIYAFGALANRKERRLYKVILDNLSDTTEIDQETADFGYYVCPADLMISYLADQIKPDQKRELQNLILTKYQHIKDSDRWLQQK